jgi:hypothetical protein
MPQAWPGLMKHEPGCSAFIAIALVEQSCWNPLAIPSWAANMPVDVPESSRKNLAACAELVPVSAFVKGSADAATTWSLDSRVPDLP